MPLAPARVTLVLFKEVTPVTTMGLPAVRVPPTRFKAPLPRLLATTVRVPLLSELAPVSVLGPARFSAPVPPKVRPALPVVLVLTVAVTDGPVWMTPSVAPNARCRRR